MTRYWFEVLENIFERKDYEPEVKECILDIATQPNIKVFADIGANIGIFTKLFCSIKKDDGLVFAFEPDPIVFDRLQHNILSYEKEYGTRIIIVDNAISDRNKIGTLYTSNEIVEGIYGRLSAGLEKDFIDIFKCPLTPVPVSIRTIDYFFFEKNQKVDLIKLDIEAEELKAIEGGRKTLEKYHPIVIIEAHAHLNKKVHEIMKSMGYKANRLDDGRFSCWE